jgi:ribosomal protein S2
MATKEKREHDSASSNDSKKITSDSIKTQLEEKVEYHNKLVAKKEELLGELNKVEQALGQSLGGIHTLQGLQNEYFVKDVPSVNGEA